MHTLTIQFGGESWHTIEGVSSDAATTILDRFASGKTVRVTGRGGAEFVIFPRKITIVQVDPPLPE